MLSGVTKTTDFSSSGSTTAYSCCENRPRTMGSTRARVRAHSSSGVGTDGVTIFFSRSLTAETSASRMALCAACMASRVF